MKQRLKLSLLFSTVIGLGILVSCGKDREADWICKCPEGIPSTNPNVGTLSASSSRYNAVTKDIAEGRCKEESVGRVSECELSKVQ